MMKRIVCYGDSNTYGYDAADLFGGRLSSEQRWTDQLSALLECNVINCGMNGRTVPRYPRSVENDLRLLRRSLPCDLLIVMLGTNDLLSDREPEDTAEALSAFMDRLLKEYADLKILIAAPPRIGGLGAGYAEQLQEYASCCKAIADEKGLLFADASQWPLALAHDGVHLSPEGHRCFAACMYEYLKTEKNLEIK